MSLPFPYQITKRKVVVPHFGNFNVNNKKYYYDKLSLSILRNTTLRKELTQDSEYFYYSENIDDVVKDKDLLVILKKKYDFIIKLKSLIYLIEDNLRQKNLKQAKIDFPINSIFIYKSKYGGILKLIVSEITLYNNDVMIISKKHKHLYDVKYCLNQRDIRLHKLKNLI